MTTYAVTNPYTGHRYGDYPVATDADVEAALAAADRAHHTWARPASPEERATKLRAIASLLRERAPEFGVAQRHETGKPLAHGANEAGLGAAYADYFADNAALLAEDIPVEYHGEGTAVVRRTPLGALLCIVPWNAPVMLTMRFVASSLAVGNTVIIKPDPHSAETADVLQRVFNDAGTPEGAITTLRATEGQIATMIADPRLRGVSLTGSARAGRAVAEIAGRNLTPVSLELGGSDPFIVLSTDDLDATVELAFAHRMMINGQACIAAKRFIVIEDLYDEFVERMVARMRAATVGDPELDGSEIGALCSTEAAERVEAQIRGAVQQGATLAVGGEREGVLVSPGLLLDVKSGMEVYGAEIFGPVAMAHRAADEAEAVALANDTPYGLGAYVFSTDAAQAARVADAIDAGMVRVNSGINMAPHLPFGGTKASGSGREEGLMAADEFCNMKLIYTAT